MQTAAPEAFDLSKETDDTLKLYGLPPRADHRGSAGSASRPDDWSSRGVRFVELIDTGSSNNWDSHGDMADHGRLAKNVDLPIAGLLAGPQAEQTARQYARRVDDGIRADALQQHRGGEGPGAPPWAFSSWLAGAGVKGGVAHGETDEYGIRVAKDGVHVHDFHATILHLMGLDHTKLTYRHAGRDYRLTDVHGKVVEAGAAMTPTTRRDDSPQARSMTHQPPHAPSPSHVASRGRLSRSRASPLFSLLFRPGAGVSDEPKPAAEAHRRLRQDDSPDRREVLLELPLHEGQRRKPGPGAVCRCGRHPQRPEGAGKASSSRSRRAKCRRRRSRSSPPKRRSNYSGWIRRLPRRRGEGALRRPRATSRCGGSSNAEYNYTVRDLTGVDLQPGARVPRRRGGGRRLHQRRGSAALTSRRPSSPSTSTPRRTFSSTSFCSPTGSASRRPRRAATGPTKGPPSCGRSTPRPRSRRRQAARRNRTSSPRCVTATRSQRASSRGRRKEKMNAKYLRALWEALTDKTPSQPLDTIRAKWRTATEKDVTALASEVNGLQTVLWRTVRVGNYVQDSWGTVEEGLRREPDAVRCRSTRPPAASVPIRFGVKPAPGQSEVTLYLIAREGRQGGPVVWRRPRFESRREAGAFAPRLRAVRPRVRSRLPRCSPTAGSTSRPRSNSPTTRSSRPKTSRRSTGSTRRSSSGGGRCWPSSPSHATWQGGRPHRARRALTLLEEKLPERRSGKPQSAAGGRRTPTSPSSSRTRRTSPSRFPGECRRRASAFTRRRRSSSRRCGPRAGCDDRNGRTRRSFTPTRRAATAWRGGSNTAAGTGAAVFGEGPVDLGGEAPACPRRPRR